MLATLDGFFEGPNGELDWTFIVWDEEFQQLMLFYTDVGLNKRLATKMWTN
ncbi:MAG TPA: hypothetical protein VE244_02015 [Nitrososphaeraceae archaeon]|jgi:hypothetical protein|nr:hypothetical protein [Nitrososphaeraceae archaeon]